MGRKRFRPTCEGQRRSTLPPRSPELLSITQRDASQIRKHQISAHSRRTGFCSVPGSRRARKSLLSACSAGDFPLEASQFSKSLIRTLCSTWGSLTAIVIVELLMDLVDPIVLTKNVDFKPLASRHYRHNLALGVERRLERNSRDDQGRTPYAILPHL